MYNANWWSEHHHTIVDNLACPRIASQIAAMPSQLASQVSNRRKQTRRCDTSPSHRSQIAKSQIEFRPKLASQHILLQLPSIRVAENLQAAQNYNKTQSIFEKNVLARRGCCYLTRIFEPFAMQLHAMLVSAFCHKPKTTLHLFHQK